MRRLPGSNLLFGLPVVFDTNDETIKEGSRVRAAGEAGGAAAAGCKTGPAGAARWCNMLGTFPWRALQVLLQYKGQKLGVLEVESKWAPLKPKETRLAYGTSSLEHPGQGRRRGERWCAQRRASARAARSLAPGGGDSGLVCANAARRRQDGGVGAGAVLPGWARVGL